MAEGVGLAASVAGLVSLGLQITGGIVKYLDAFDSRHEELNNVQQHNNALETTLKLIQAATSSLQDPPADFTAAVVQRVEFSKKELDLVNASCAELVDSSASTWIKKLENRKKKLTYAFHRSKLQQLAQRLQQATANLQLNLAGLGLKISSSNTNDLLAIKSLAQGHASDLLLVQSELAAVGTPLARIHEQLPQLRDNINTITHLVESRSGSIVYDIRETSVAIRQDLHHSHSSLGQQLKQQQEAIRRLENLMVNLLPKSLPGHHSRAKVAYGAGYRPALLKELYDSIQTTSESHGYHEPAALSDSSQQSQFNPSGKLCICPRPYTSVRTQQVNYGHLLVSNGYGIQSHWPSCPLAKTPVKKAWSISLRYTSLATILKAAVEFSFSLTYGAGGFSISPNFTYYPIVDKKLSPSFRILHLMDLCWRACEQADAEKFMMSCIRKLSELLHEKDVCPTAVTLDNQSLMHFAAKSLKPTSLGSHSDTLGMSLFVELFQMLISHGVPAVTHDTRGVSPMFLVYQIGTDERKSLVDLLLAADLESQPATTIGLPAFRNAYRQKIPRIYSASHNFAEAWGCGPLSMAVVCNDVDAVARILNRSPSSLTELDIYGLSPLHLAVGKPQILNLLVEGADPGLLEQRDNNGFSVLDTAMIESSALCVNGSRPERCRQCACTQCVDILLEAGCKIRTRMHQDRDMVNFGGAQTVLFSILRVASELARRRYVYHMREERESHPRRFPTHQNHHSYRAVHVSQTDMALPPTTAIPQLRAGFQELENWDWIYREINDVKHAQLFYRHGFQPSPSLLLSGHCMVDPIKACDDYLYWLVEHGVDLFLRSPNGPPMTHSHPNVGIFGAHRALYTFNRSFLRKPMVHANSENKDAFNKLMKAISVRKLADGCQCHCSVEGCTPFIWMMKGIRSHNSSRITGWLRSLPFFYVKCDPDLVRLTSRELISFATFCVLGLVHTCCDPLDLVEFDNEWAQTDDIFVINGEQEHLLGLHERLVEEFENKALELTKDNLNGPSFFQQFWESYWSTRIQSELEKLDGSDLTEEERRSAEEIGVQWHGPKRIPEKENPFENDSLEYYLFELGSIEHNVCRLEKCCEPCVKYR